LVPLRGNRPPETAGGEYGRDNIGIARRYTLRVPEHPLLRSAALASLLSFFLPGLGHATAGAPRRGLLVAIPVLVVLAGAAAIWIGDRSLVVRLALTPSTLLALVGLSLALLLYRLWATLDAWAIGRRREPARTVPWRVASLAVLAIVLGATLLMHGWVAYVGWSAHQTLTAVFSPTGPVGAIPTETADVDEIDETHEPTSSPQVTPIPTPSPTPLPNWAADGRLNVLLIGSDAGPGRWSMRADAIILVSIEIESGRVAAFSIPRYTTQVPLPEPAASAYDCRCLPEPINALYVEANARPDVYPGGDLRGFVALMGAIEELTGVQLDGMAVADMNGFVQLVDAIGGITVDVPAAVYDPAYPDPDGVTEVELSVAPGVQRMDGWHALAYARTRHQDGDVMRMQRQQHVLDGLQRELGCDLLGNLTAILEVARDTLWTNLPLADVPDMMMRIEPGPVESHSLFDVHNPVITADEVERIHAEVAGAFDGPAPPDDRPDLDC
jgi:polyisoprenyl-teichoic acid--peptidoglycan teichoic acid transferase